MQYAATYRFNHGHLWILDHPHSRMMTTILASDLANDPLAGDIAEVRQKPN